MCVSYKKRMIETGRYNQTPSDKKLCPVCDSNENEDEIHSLYFTRRNEFLSQR